MKKIFKTEQKIYYLVLQPDGKILIKSTGTYRRGNIAVNVFNLNGKLVFNSIKECAFF